MGCRSLGDRSIAQSYFCIHLVVVCKHCKAVQIQILSEDARCTVFDGDFMLRPGSSGI